MLMLIKAKVYVFGLCNVLNELSNYCNFPRAINHYLKGIPLLYWRNGNLQISKYGRTDL